MNKIVIIGTGKMARNIGGYLLGLGYSIVWVSDNKSRLESIEKFGNRILKRLMRVEPGKFQKISFNAINYSGLESEPDIIIESTRESLEYKKKCLSRIKINEKNTIILSNSSSILPGEISSLCAGFHFFYPVELTGFVETIFSPEYDKKKKARVLKIIHDWKLSYIEENEKNAFAVNRIFLPLQAECFRLLRKGYESGIIDQASAFGLMRIGQLKMMDSVGLDVILPAVRNYIEMGPVENRNDYDVLVSELSGLVEKGILGNKSDNGIMSKYIEDGAEKRIDISELEERFYYIFLNNCMGFIKNKILNNVEISIILDNVFAIEIDIQDVIKSRKQKILDFLNNMYYKSLISYFKPFDGLYDIK